MRNGVFKDGAGRYSGGKREMTKRPYAGDNEHVADLVQVQVKENKASNGMARSEN